MALTMEETSQAQRERRTSRTPLLSVHCPYRKLALAHHSSLRDPCSSVTRRLCTLSISGALLILARHRRLAHVRAQKPTDVDADGKRITVELHRNAAAVVEFEIKVTDRLVVDPRVVAVVAHEVRGTRGDAGSGEPLAVLGRTAGVAFGGGATTEDPADHRLIAPRRDIIRRGRETEVAKVVFNAAVELSVIAEGDEWTMEKSCIHDGITRAEVEERRKISEGVVYMVRQIPSCMTGA